MSFVVNALYTSGGTAYDPIVRWDINGTQMATIKVDNSQSDQFEIITFEDNGILLDASNDVVTSDPITVGGSVYGDGTITDTGDITITANGNDINMRGSADWGTINFLYPNLFETQIGTVNGLGGLILYVNTTTQSKFLPYTDNQYDLGQSNRAWKDIYYEGSLTDTSPDKLEKELKTKDKKPLDYHITRDDETLNIEYAPESVLFKINDSVAMDVGEANVLALLQISQLKEELCLYEKKYSWCNIDEGVKLEK